MSDTIVGIFCGIFFMLPPALALLSFVAKSNSDKKVIPLWQAALFVVLFIGSIGGLVGFGVVGQEHFQGEFSEAYLTFGVIVAFISGVALVMAFLDID